MEPADHFSFLQSQAVRSLYFGVQGTSGRQGGMGLVDRVTIPNAVPSATTKIPSMIFAFMCLSSAAVAAWHGF
jgi:hypothetical protein